MVGITLPAIPSVRTAKSRQFSMHKLLLKITYKQLIDTLYYQFTQLSELKAPQDIYLKNIVIHKHYKYN